MGSVIVRPPEAVRRRSEGAILVRQDPLEQLRSHIITVSSRNVDDVRVWRRGRLMDGRAASLPGLATREQSIARRRKRVHAIIAHGHADTPQLREDPRKMMKEEPSQ